MTSMWRNIATIAGKQRKAKRRQYAKNLAKMREENERNGLVDKRSVPLGGLFDIAP